MHPAIQIDRATLADLCRRHHVRELALFGSAAREDFDAARSDVDFLVEFEPEHLPSLAGLVHLKDDLSVLLGGRPVDVATRAILDNPFRRRRIEADLTPLWCS